MKRLIDYLPLFVVGLGIIFMGYLAVQSLSPPKIYEGPPKVVDKNYEESIMSKEKSCNSFCKQKHGQPGTDVVGRLKVAPDGENLVCLCYRKKIKEI